MCREGAWLMPASEVPGQDPVIRRARQNFYMSIFAGLTVLPVLCQALLSETPPSGPNENVMTDFKWALSMSDSDLFDLTCCTLCPRNCRVNRAAGNVGYCGEPADLYAARAALLKWEEPVITGPVGSGAIFFSGCNMGCIFCQNYKIANTKAFDGSKHPAGIRVTPEHLSEIMLRLQDEEKATNINLVTPSHYLPVIVPALERAKDNGLTIPVVYNTSSYEKAEALKRLDGLVDIYLPDLKYVSSALSAKYSKAPDYFDIASRAIAEMVRQQPGPLFADGSHSLDEEDDADDPVMLKGVVVRHLALPGQAEDSRRVIRYLYETYGSRIFISIMNQYTPMPQVKGDPELDRRLSDEEYESLVDYAIGLGVENGFIQDGKTASESFIPEFNGYGLD